MIIFHCISTESPDAERGELTWNRGCHVKGSESLGCKEFKLGEDITVIECLCDKDDCNEKIDMTTSTNKPTTTEPLAGLKCYDCGHDEEGDCTMEKSGTEVRCQMNDPKEDYYGDNCYVGHTGKDSIQRVCWPLCTL